VKNAVIRKLLLLASLPMVLCAQSVWFDFDFSRPVPKTNWFPASGEWKFEDGSATIRTKDYDCMLSSYFYAYDNQPYTIEVVLKGVRSGIYFNLDELGSKNVSHMLRFDDRSILTGYFTAGGEYIATSVFDLSFAPEDWTNLKVIVDPIKRNYKVFVNEQYLGMDSNLVYRSGGFGLQGSEGNSTFRSVKIIGEQPQSPPAPVAIGGKAVFRHIRTVKTDGVNITFYDQGERMHQTINPSGVVVKQVIGEAPIQKVKAKNKNLSCEIDGKTILLKQANGKLVKKIVEYLSSPSEVVMDAEGTIYVADAGVGGLLKYNARGEFVKKFVAASIGSFKAPRGLDFYGKDEIVVADYDRVVFVGKDFTEGAPVARILSANQARVQWTTKSKEKSSVTVISPDKTERTLDAARSKDGTCEAIVDGLKPSTRYLYRVNPTIRTIPAEEISVRNYRFTTIPGETGKMLVSRLPVLLMIYRTISYRDRYPAEKYPNIPAGKTLSSEELKALADAVAFNREFYFRNSYCRGVLDFDTYIVEDTLWLGDVGPSDPYWLGPNERVIRDFEKASASLGKKPDDYCGIVVPYAWLNYPPRKTSAMRDPSKNDSITIRQAIGGGTHGVPAPWKFKTVGYTSNPYQDRFSRQDWLITHEFHHQIDALFASNGYEDYYHADQPWKMPGRFGEDFDFNAQIIRLCPKEEWLNLSCARLVETADKDGDGVPDDDRTLPFDEKRLNGNPNLTDTDEDGLTDLQEVMAGTSRGTALDNKDTDGDGLIDSKDPEPLYAMSPTIASVAKGTKSLPLFTNVKTKNFEASLYLGWNKQGLAVEYSSTKPLNLLFQIDADADGWFHGFDNIQIRTSMSGDTVKLADYYLRDCSSWVDSPRDRRDILKKEDVTFHSGYDKAKGCYTLTMQIPASPDYGFQMKKGTNIGIRIGLQQTGDLWVWDEVFERNFMMKMTLK
jgi:hypothetical protein